ncbi:MAG TPA: TIGR00725 family protein [Dehalococcoidia bacterium]|nr:TIGR00725 family protein [Dehalococcoidia bacterium]
MTVKNKFIAVIGNSKASAQEIKLAEEIGREIAKNGAILVCGGLDGVMEAACRGAVSEGGLTVGILPGTDRKDANEYVKIPVVTGIGYARNIIVVKSAQAVIAIGGGYGTLTEVGFALKNGIPVIGLGTWKISNKDKPDDAIIRVDNAVDAVAMALDMISD